MNYQICIDSLSQQQWEQCACKFTDYNLYQTWAYQQVRAQNDRQQLERVVIKDKNNEVLTMCSIRIKNSKALGLKIGYVQWGPLLGSPKLNSESLTAALKLLIDEYLGPKVNILRLVPNLVDDETGKQISRVFELCGLKPVKSVPRYRTMIIDLTPSTEEIRNRLHKSWERYLKKAEKNNIEIREGTQLEYFDILKRLYISSLQRKRFRGLNPEEFIEVQKLLTPGEKMNAVVAYYDNEPVTAHVTSHLGNTALGILAASSEKGLECWASYLVWWVTLLSAKQAGMKIYDLAGIDPDTNPSVYQFKLRMGARESFHVGAFESSCNLRAKATWRIVEKAYSIIKKRVSR